MRFAHLGDRLAGDRDKGRTDEGDRGEGLLSPCCRRWRWRLRRRWRRHWLFVTVKIYFMAYCCDRCYYNLISG